MFDVYRLSNFLVHANNRHKHPARTLITEASVARDEIPPSARTLMGELEKQEARKAARLSTRKSKGAQSEDQIPATSESPLNIEAIPHKYSVDAWLIEATAGNTRTRKTARKTTSINPLSQTTIDDFYRRNDGNDDNEPKSKRLKEDKHSFATISRAKDDHLAETINLIDETLEMCREDISGSIKMIVDSGASHILLRHEHAHVLQNVICDNSKSYATKNP
jgi:hypothetical protein